MSFSPVSIPLDEHFFLTPFIRAVDEPLAIGRELRVALVDCGAGRMHLPVTSRPRQRADLPDAFVDKLREEQRLSVRRPRSRGMRRASEALDREMIGHATVQRPRHESRWISDRDPLSV